MATRTPTVSNNPNLNPNVELTQLHPVPPGIDKLITLVDRCWVCNGVFPDYGGSNGALVQEFHHPVPRSFGGADGPVISICSGHHATVHDTALRIRSGVPYDDLVGHESPLHQARILKLAHVIVNAMTLFQKDPNRRVPISFSLPQDLNERFKLAAKSRGQTTSQLLGQLVVDLVNKEFPKRRS